METIYFPTNDFVPESMDSIKLLTISFANCPTTLTAAQCNFGGNHSGALFPARLIGKVSLLVLLFLLTLQLCNVHTPEPDAPPPRLHQEGTPVTRRCDGRRRRRLHCGQPSSFRRRRFLQSLPEPLQERQCNCAAVAVAAAPFRNRLISMQICTCSKQLFGLC